MSPDPMSLPADRNRREPARIGYVLKMYPRFSETFVVSEILAREARGTPIEIFSLRPPVDPRFHDTLARVQAPVSYIPRARKAEDLWAALDGAHGSLEPGRLADAFPELLRASASDAAQALDLAVALRERGVTHLHAHFASLATTVARLASLLTGVPYSFTAHAKDLFHASVDPAENARKIADAHHVVTVSDHNVRHLRQRYPQAVAATAVHRVYNGLDLSAFPFRPPAERPAAARPARTVVGVGRLVEKKGFSVLLDAVALLREAGRDVRCRLVGGGPLEEELRVRVQVLGLRDAVTLTGPLPQDQVRAEVGAADALAAPCVIGSDGNADGLPTVLLEAMALGTPCVSTDVTGIGEVVRHGETGLQVPQHDAPALAAALARLLDAPALADRLARAARGLVEREFDAAVQAARLEALLVNGPDATAGEPAPAVPRTVPPSRDELVDTLPGGLLVGGRPRGL